MTFFVRTRSGARGMTLLETLSAMFILTILMTAAVALYIQGSQHFARTTNDLDAEREARAAMGATTAELRQAMPPRGALPITPVISPTTPQPAATAVTFYEVQDIASAVVSGDQLDTSLLRYDRMTIHIDPSATPPANLVEDGIDDFTGKALPQRILGREVLTFEVTPQALDAYDLKIVTAPNVRLDLRDPNNPSLHQYTLTSTVYISYFKGTN
jgi:prepilin-type N-terminal cleavage/methylation domain-containing protein